MAPIPICMCGKQPSHAAPFAENMMPEYDVVYHFQSQAAFESEFPSLLVGQRISNPQSSIGSNLTRWSSNTTPLIPQAVFLGADFTEPEIEQMSSEYPNLPWLACAEERRWESKRIADANPDGPPAIVLVTRRAKECLERMGSVEGGTVRGGVWRY